MTLAYNVDVHVIVAYCCLSILLFKHVVDDLKLLLGSDALILNLISEVIWSRHVLC